MLSLLHAGFLDDDPNRDSVAVKDEFASACGDLNKNSTPKVTSNCCDSDAIAHARNRIKHETIEIIDVSDMRSFIDHESDRKDMSDINCALNMSKNGSGDSKNMDPSVNHNDMHLKKMSSKLQAMPKITHQSQAESNACLNRGNNLPLKRETDGTHQHISLSSKAGNNQNGVSRLNSDTRERAGTVNPDAPTQHVFQPNLVAMEGPLIPPHPSGYKVTNNGNSNDKKGEGLVASQSKGSKQNYDTNESDHQELAINDHCHSKTNNKSDPKLMQCPAIILSDVIKTRYSTLEVRNQTSQSTDGSKTNKTKALRKSKIKAIAKMDETVSDIMTLEWGGNQTPKGKESSKTNKTRAVRKSKIKAISMIDDTMSDIMTSEGEGSNMESDTDWNMEGDIDTHQTPNVENPNNDKHPGEDKMAKVEATLSHASGHANQNVDLISRCSTSSISMDIPLNQTVIIEPQGMNTPVTSSTYQTEAITYVSPSNSTVFREESNNSKPTKKRNKKKPCTVLFCVYCNAKLKHLGEIQDHFVSVHQFMKDPDPERFLRCSICKTKHSVVADFVKHRMHMHTMFKCSICSAYIAKHRMVFHLETMHGLKDQPHNETELLKLYCIEAKCGWCDKLFGDELCYDMLMDHFQSAHKIVNLEYVNKTDMFPCGLCPQLLTSATDLIAHHEQYHSGTQTFKCFQCPELLNTSKSLVSHIKRKHTPIQCELCDSLSMTMRRFLRHESGVHVKPYKCKYCPATFGSSQSFKAHTERHENPASQQVQCDICEKWFGNQTYLKTHKRKNHTKEEFKCGKCDKTFPCLEFLKRHEERHGTDRPHQCDICAKCFQTKRTLQAHKEVHIEEKTHKCDQCPKTFKNRGGLYMHKRSTHTERNFVCDICAKSFKSSNHLKYHMLVHTGERAFKCPVRISSFRLKQGYTLAYTTVAYVTV